MVLKSIPHAVQVLQNTRTLRNVEMTPEISKCSSDPQGVYIQLMVRAMGKSVQKDLVVFTGTEEQSLRAAEVDLEIDHGFRVILFDSQRSTGQAQMRP